MLLEDVGVFLRHLAELSAALEAGELSRDPEGQLEGPHPVHVGAPSDASLLAVNQRRHLRLQDLNLSCKRKGTTKTTPNS